MKYLRAENVHTQNTVIIMLQNTLNEELFCRNQKMLPVQFMRFDFIVLSLLRKSRKFILGYEKVLFFLP